MEPTIHKPPEALSSYIEYFWTLECCCQKDSGLTFNTFANGVSGIIFQHHNGRSAWGSTTALWHPVSNGDTPTSFVYGKRTRPWQAFAKGPFGVTGVVFKPQAQRMLLNIDPVHLTNGPVELDEFSREHVGEQLLNARSQRERLARLRDFLRARVEGARPEDMLVTESLRLIHQRIRSIRVRQLLRCMNLSERQFERRFVRAVGVTPHLYIRIARFQEAVRLMKTEQFERLSDVAYDLNYADQSHLIKDIKEFSGFTPTRLVQTVRTCVDLPCLNRTGIVGELIPKEDGPDGTTQQVLPGAA